MILWLLVCQHFCSTSLPLKRRIVIAPKYRTQKLCLEKGLQFIKEVVGLTGKSGSGNGSGDLPCSCYSRYVVLMENAALSAVEDQLPKAIQR